MADWRLDREEISLATSERFRPPPHRRAQHASDRVQNQIRRFFDLQFGSIWSDLAKLLPAVQGTVADVGCGAQPFRDLIPPDVHYIPVDIADSDSRFGYQSTDTRYYDGKVLPLAADEVDVVLCTETLEHVLEPAPFLNEIARVVKPGGRLILTVPFAARWHFIPFDYWRYTPSALRHLLAEARFTEIRIYPRGGSLAVAGYKLFGWILILLIGRQKNVLALLSARLLGILLLPVALVAVLMGNLGLLFPDSGDDTLGYTVIARKENAVR